MVCLFVVFIFFTLGLIEIPALNQQEQDGVRRPVRYGTKKPKKQQQQQQPVQQEAEKAEESTEDQSKKNLYNLNGSFSTYFEIKLTKIDPIH